MSPILLLLGLSIFKMPLRLFFFPHHFDLFLREEEPFSRWLNPALVESACWGAARAFFFTITSNIYFGFVFTFLYLSHVETWNPSRLLLLLLTIFTKPFAFHIEHFRKLLCAVCFNQVELSHCYDSDARPHASSSPASCAVYFPTVTIRCRVRIF